jgi:hypothetical protein
MTSKGAIVAKRARPSVNVTPIADRHAPPGCRIIEFSFPDGTGGLIALASAYDGQPYLSIYRYDPALQIEVSTGQEHRAVVSRRADNSVSVRMVKGRRR